MINKMKKMIFFFFFNSFNRSPVDKSMNSIFVSQFNADFSKVPQLYLAFRSSFTAALGYAMSSKGFVRKPDNSGESIL